MKAILNNWKLYAFFGALYMVETFLFMLMMTLGFGKVMYIHSGFGYLKDILTYPEWYLIAGIGNGMGFILGLALIGLGLWLKDNVKALY